MSYEDASGVSSEWYDVLLRVVALAINFAIWGAIGRYFVPTMVTIIAIVTVAEAFVRLRDYAVWHSQKEAGAT